MQGGLVGQGRWGRSHIRAVGSHPSLLIYLFSDGSWEGLAAGAVRKGWEGGGGGREGRRDCRRQLRRAGQQRAGGSAALLGPASAEGRSSAGAGDAMQRKARVARVLRGARARDAVGGGGRLLPDAGCEDSTAGRCPSHGAESKRACPATGAMPGVLAALPSPPTMRARGAQQTSRLCSWGRSFARCGTASLAGSPLLRERGRFGLWPQ